MSPYIFDSSLTVSSWNGTEFKLQDPRYDWGTFPAALLIRTTQWKLVPASSATLDYTWPHNLLNLSYPCTSLFALQVMYWFG